MGFLVFTFYHLQREFSSIFALLIAHTLDKLTDHDLERKEDAENRMMIQHEVIIPVKDITETDVDDEELHRLVGIIETNSIAFTNARDGVMGRALYPTLSLANHSCIANTRFAGKRMKVCKSL